MMQPGTTDIFGQPVGPKDVAEFQADFPYDGEERGDAIVQWPGRGIAEAICQMFRDMAFQVTSPRDEQEDGWSFIVAADRQKFWFRVSDLGDSAILVSKDMGGAPGPGGIPYAALLGKLDEQLTADPRFRNIRWFTLAEYHARPAEGIPLDLSYDPARPLPEIKKVGNFHVGLLRTLLFVVLRFFGLPSGLVLGAFAINGLQDHDPSAKTLAGVGAALILAGTLGARWLVRKQVW